MGGSSLAYLKALALTSCVVLALFAGAYVASALDSPLAFDSYRSQLSMAAGLLLLLVGTVLRVWASYSLYANRLSVLRVGPQSKILESGPYSHSRNPLFLGLFVLATGWVLYLGSPFGLLCTVLFFFVVNLWARKEEAELERQFGEDYVRYKKSVPRWGWRIRPL